MKIPNVLHGTYTAIILFILVIIFVPEYIVGHKIDERIQREKREYIESYKSTDTTNIVIDTIKIY